VVKALSVLGETLGLISSLLLVWGYTPPAGVVGWVSGDGSKAKRSAARLAIIARAGFALLAASFFVKLYLIAIT
jgi:hypothetical protein